MGNEVGRPVTELGRPTTGHPLSDAPLPYRTVMDVGIRSYDEFACSRSTLSWMQSAQIPEGHTLAVVEECVGGHNLIVQVRPKEEGHQTVAPEASQMWVRQTVESTITKGTDEAR